MTGDRRPPPGVTEILRAAGAPASALDLGCGSGRLTVALASSGAAVTGLDVSPARLAAAEERARAAAVPVRLVQADMTDPLPFGDGAFSAVVSRLSLMIAPDPAAVLREAVRVLEPGGIANTAVWASVEENPWFAEPRAAVAAALGSERAAFARVFGRLGAVDALAEVHRDAGLGEVDGRVLRDELRPRTAAEHWSSLTTSIGHFRRLAASLSAAETAAVAAEVERRLEPYRVGDGLRLPRAMVLVTARRP